MNKKFYPVIAAVFAALLFVFMGVWIRMMNESFTTAQQVFWRMLLAAALAWIFFGRTFSKKLFTRLTGKNYFFYFLRAALNYGVGVMLFTVAINNANLSTVSFISALPIMGLLAWIMFREKFDLQALPFVVLSVVGLGLVAKISLSSLSLGIGETAAIVSMLGFDIAWLMVRYHPKFMNNYQNTTLMLSFAWVVPLVYILATGQSIMPDSVSTKALIGLLASGFFNVVNLYVLNYIFLNLKGYVAGNLLLLEGVFAIVVGYLFYSETPGLLELFGAAIIVGCAVAIARMSAKRQEAIPEVL